MEARRRVVLDTDLGSDVDDALALAVLLGSREVDLLGATTVYGDVALRARLLAGFAALAGRRVPCFPGRAEPLSGKPVWVSGEEGRHFTDLDQVLASDEPLRDGDGVGWLLEQARRAGGELEILAIGPLTNLAHAVRADPGFAGRVRRVWLMGGLFAGGGPAEHNFASDAMAAAEVFGAGLPITAVGLEITRQLRLGESEVAGLGGLGRLGAQLERETRAWTAYWHEPYDVPHDAVAAVLMLRPDLFERRGVRVRVEPAGPDAGRVVPDAEGGSLVDVVTGLDVPAVTRQILDRIRNACQPPVRPVPSVPSDEGEPCAT